MWCHLSTGLGRLRSLRFVAMLLTTVALFTTLFFAHNASAVQSTSKTVSFQGRLQTASGAVVADGHYNMQFKIYQDGSGASVGNPGGSLKWTESYINNGGTNGVEVRNGYFSVSLGSLNSFGTSVDWDQDTLWLSMNVAGTAAACSTFGSAPCGADGEMLPMKRIAATPYAINAGAVGGKTVDNLVQMAQGVQTDASTNTSSIHINKTGTGNLVQLQNTATDIFTVTNSGNLTLGSNADKTISVETSGAATAGRQLALTGGGGGSGSGSTGGSVILQGGSAGGTDGDGGSIQIDAGAKTGTGSGGTIAIGMTNASAIVIGSNTQALNQTITIGTNNTVGSTSNVIIGGGGNATAGTTTVRAKNAVTVETNGSTRATFSGTENSVYFGNGVSSATPNNFTIQGTNSTAATIAAGSLTVQGGNATTGDANGGSVTLSGGAGSGTGANGLVVITTPSYQTVTNDANCYTGGAPVAASCTITQTNVNNSAAIMVGFTTTYKVATLPDPTNRTAGRVIYVTAANGSEAFSVRANAGEDTEQTVILKQNSTATLFWNGNDWTSASGGGATLQETYDNSQQIYGNSELYAYKEGLSIRNGNSSAINSTLLDVQSAGATKLFSVNSGTNEYSLNGGAEIPGVNSASFPDFNWGVAGTSTIQRYTTKDSYIQTGNASLRISSGASYSGAYNRLTSPLTPSKTYTVSLSARLETGGPFTNFGILYTSDGSNVAATCQDNVTISASEWTKITCSFQTPASGITGDNTIALGQLGNGTYTYYIDNMSVTESGTVNGGGSATPNVQIGGGAGSGSTTLFTIDKAASAPTSVNEEALLGSMYYDTTIGKVQCYEAEGWGTCGANPDTFVTLSPEFPNAVTNGGGAGTMTSDFCSDALNINDSGVGTTVCGTNETHNFYKWAGTGTTDQTKSIYITYKLPSSFKKFAEGTTSLMGRTDSTNATVNYQVYRNTSAGLTACGSTTAVSTGNQATWQKGTATSTADPANCNFAAGDDMVIRINMTGRNTVSAYVSNLAFTFNNK
ncbi:hypothetical protein EON76_01230 [bacterium]|nr:MAG: hypothetical protein EON76_01230 [bacterium]